MIFLVGVFALSLLMSCGSERDKSSLVGKDVVSSQQVSDINQSGKDDEDSLKNKNGSGNDEENSSKGGENLSQSGNTDNENLDDIILPKDKILFVADYSNWAEGYQRMGMFLDSRGDAYYYDFSNPYSFYDSKDTPLLEKFEMIREYTEPAFNIGTDIMKKIYALGSRLPEKVSFKVENEACDMGQSSLYFVNDKNAMVEISSGGDNKKTPTDEAALALDAYYDTVLPLLVEKNKEKTVQCVSLFTAEEIGLVNIHSDGGNYSRIKENCGQGGIGRFVMKDPEAVREMLRYFELPTESFEDMMEKIPEPDNGIVTYFVEISIAHTGGHIDEVKGIFYQDGMARFIPSDKNRSPKSDECVTEAIEYFVHIGAFPYRSELYAKDLMLKTKIKDQNGQEWQEVVHLVDRYDEMIPDEN